MKLATWLTQRECAYRWPLLLAEVAVVATAVALALGLELVGRGREAAVATQIDQMGAAFRLLPRGSSAVAVQRLEGLDRLLPANSLARASDQLSFAARLVEPRLTVLAPAGTGKVPVVGITSAAGVARDLGPREVAVGELLAQRLGLHPSSALRLYGEVFQVREVLPGRGDEDDLVAFASLSALQEAAGLSRGINEIRLFPRVGTREALQRAAHEAFPEETLLVADRGEVAEKEIPSSLRKLRATVFVLLAFAAALGLLAAGRLSAAERSKELAILAAVGANARTLFAALLARSCVVGLAGGLVGSVVATAIAFGQDAASMRALPGLALSLGVALTAATALSGLTALPTALAAARADPFRLLADP